MSSYDMTGKPFNFATLVDDVAENETTRRDALAASSDFFTVRVWLGGEWVALVPVRGLEAAEKLRDIYRDDNRATDIIASGPDHDPALAQE